LAGCRVSLASYTVLLWYLASVADADARELDRRLLHLELVVSRLAEQVKQLVEDMNALCQAGQEGSKRMRSVTLGAVLVLAACSQPSQPAAQVPEPPAQTATQRAAHVEAQAASRDSSATRDQIKGVQGRLQRDGFYNGPIDGVWGPDTAAAVSRYQHAHGFEETGKLNRETLDSFSPP
jgi:hypothetical protein